MSQKYLNFEQIRNLEQSKQEPQRESASVDFLRRGAILTGGKFIPPSRAEDIKPFYDNVKRKLIPARKASVREIQANASR
ncbi:hypothetical protein MHBO_001639 [Bonamia ostreae]|uniref:Uncharacterized protein n=1 Tax=Bonamia ostreae TaxID=126728 RepID=A0ABV2AJT0_9EUKA